MSTIKDVSRMAHVSTTTVSIIINGKAEERHISQETINKVNKAVKELNYQPSISAKTLRTAEPSKFTVGLYWVTESRTSLLARFINGLQQRKLTAKIDVNIVICPYRANKLCEETDIYSTNSYNAIIIANASEKDMFNIHEKKLLVPTIINNRYTDLYHMVAIDNEAAGALAAEHLAERNVKSAGIVCLNSGYHAMNSATKGFAEKCKESNIVISKKHIFFTGLTIEDGYEIGKKLCDLGELPEAIFFDNDSTAIGALSFFNKHGVRVPDDVQLIAMGLGNPNYARFYTPSITVIDIPLEKMGKECFDIIEKIAVHSLDGLEHRIFQPKIYPRQSTKML